LLAVSGGDPAAASATLLRVVDRAGQPRFESPAGLGAVAALVFSPDGGTLVATGFDTEIRVWEVRTGKLKHRMEEMPLAMFDAVFSPDGNRLATAGADQAIYLWDTKSWKVARKIEGQPETVWRIRFSPDGTKLVSGGMSALSFAAPVKVILWDVASGRQLQAWNAEHRVVGLAFSPDGRQVAVADGSNAVKLWAVPN
jgi:WD40 repeat protein